MPVPAEIRAVPRPKNTVVVETNNSDMKRYAVRERKRVDYVPGGNPQPRNGRVIGHIWNNEFHPIENRKAKAAIDPELKIQEKYRFPLSYGLDALMYRESVDLFSDLAKFFDFKEAATMLTVAMIRVKKPSVTNGRVKDQYLRSYLQEYYPGLNMSKSAMTTLCQKIGENVAARTYFTQERLSRVLAGQRIVIDGMLKNNDSAINDLSQYSRKSKVLDCKQINVMYAIDVDKGEPLALGVYPGNATDAAVFGRFVEDAGITKGLMIADKGFPPKAVEKYISQHQDLGYLLPIRLNDKRIKAYDMLNADKTIEGFGRLIMGKKVALPNGRFLYAFVDTKAKLEQQLANYRQIFAGKKSLESFQDLAQEEATHGAIVFESNVDMSLMKVYKSYHLRWTIELVFKRYKNELCCDTTRVHSDKAVIGNEFINFLASILMTRLLNLFSEAGFLDDDTLQQVLEDLDEVKRVPTDKEVPRLDDGYWGYVSKAQGERLVSLGLAQISLAEEMIKNQPPKKPGRKRVKPEFVGPKRPPGRPRKS